MQQQIIRNFRPFGASQRKGGVVFLRTLITLILLPSALLCQDAQSDGSGDQPPRHVLFVIPNFRTIPMPEVYKPIPVKEKFKIAWQDSFDRGTVALAAVFAGEGLYDRATPSFGEGVEGYARYFGTSYADFVIGNFMTEGIFPTILHQDPRYFRKGTGGRLKRLGYAVGQIFWTHTDSGGSQFNYSEVVGNSAAVAISMAYYPNSRNVGDAVEGLALQIGVDTACNIVKEFWPASPRTSSHKHTAAD